MDIIIPKQGNSSYFFYFKELYFLYGFTEKLFIFAILNSSIPHQWSNNSHSTFIKIYHHETQSYPTDTKITAGRNGSGPLRTCIPRLMQR